ncbi:MAG: photosystem II biogenesis protein Psp29, partial [Microcystaceae cyanobacterium]
INSIYRRFVDELLVEIHLLTVNVDFCYDSIFALGVVTSFQSFMQGYQPESEKTAIFAALGQALGNSSEQYQRDAQSLLENIQALPLTDLGEKLTQGDTSGLPNQALKQVFETIHHNSSFKYSRLFAIGLETLLLKADASLKDSPEKRDRLLTELSNYLNFSFDKLQKDLELYRNNLDKVDQLLKVIEEAAEAERKKREKQAQVAANPNPVP